MRSKRQERLVRVQSLELYVSSVKNYAQFTMMSNIGRFSGVIEDPVDFIADMAGITGKYRFDKQSFGKTFVTVTTDAVVVNKPYLADMEQIKDWSHGDSDEICIYAKPYMTMMREMDIHLPVNQHCAALFNLYMNALKYLYTMSCVPTDKHEVSVDI